MDTIGGTPRDLSEIGDRTDSREILAHARQQADRRGFDDVFIVDIDSHVNEGRRHQRPQCLRITSSNHRRRVFPQVRQGYQQSALRS